MGNVQQKEPTGTGVVSIVAGLILAIGINTLIVSHSGYASQMYSPTVSSQAEAAQLTGYAVLPADTLAEGPQSGAFAGNGERKEPKYQKQPVQGFSGVIPHGDGSYYVMPDNGFGNRKNSSDFYLRLYIIRPDFRTSTGGTGKIIVERDFIQLRDPDRKVNFLIVNENTKDRLLTGGDFDIESFAQSKDGTFWFGDEFGPFLLHTDATGKVLSEPIELPNFREGKNAKKHFIRSPDNPFLTFPESSAQNPSNLPRSRGFEGMAISPDKTKLYPLLEGAVVGDPTERLILNEFDLTTGQYTGRQWFYRLETGTNHISDMATANKHEFLVIERDSKRGASAEFKKIFRIDIDAKDRDGYLVKEEVADLMNIVDPNNIARFGHRFTFPYECIEGLAILDPTSLVVLNDNNYPNEGGRDTGVKNRNEFLILNLRKALDIAPGISVR